ncbi:MAG: hypothetical protein FWH26_01890 [Oscillospiraceae bacterium]|nr:hypothetical protein [Oscillospiraceae bacterium]
MDDRKALIKMGGQEYELLLTTRATKQIATRYGGLEELGDKLMKTENFELALEEFCWLLMVLANQPIMIWNLWNPDNKKPLLTEEAVELLTTPLDLAEYKNAITEAMAKGTARNVVSAVADGNGGNAAAS